MQRLCLFISIFVLLSAQAGWTQHFTEIAATAFVDDNQNNKGVAWGDYDNDGYPDLYVGAGLGPNRLYNNNQNSTFTDVAGNPGINVDDPGSANTTIWGDYDNDGDIDLYVTNTGNGGFLHKLFRNDRDDGLDIDQFTSVESSANLTTNGNSGADWVDYDSDGFLDLYISNDGNPSALYQNNGSGAFTNVGGPLAELGGGAASWGDYDNDGDPDLYVSKLAGTNALWRNDGGGVFVDRESTMTGAIASNSRGASWADYDDDGDLDLFVNSGSNDALFQNNGPGAGYSFTNIAANPLIALDDSNDNLSAVWLDYQNDGWLDLVVGRFGAPNRLYQNNGNNTFTDISAAAGVGDSQRPEGIAAADYDNDGDRDFYVSNYNRDTNLLYQNNVGTNENWLYVDLVGTVSNRSAIGARVTAQHGPWIRHREVSGGSGWFSQNDARVEIGVSLATQVDVLTVEWPSGIVQVFNDIAANQTITIVENTSPTHVTNTNDSGIGSLRQAILNANATTGVVETITFNIPGAGPHTIAPLSALPQITDPVIIDGATQPGYSGTPIVEIDGSGLSGTPIGIDIHGGGSTVRGLMVNGFSAHAGIHLRAIGGNTVEACYLGVDATGTIAKGNGAGLTVPCANNFILNNLASGNLTGINFGAGATGNVVQGNLIGTDASGTATLGNSNEGILLGAGASNNTIGGTTPTERNIISGNVKYGVHIRNWGGDPTGNVVQGNYIGTDVTGTVAIPNGTHSNPGMAGIRIAGATNNTIGGTASGAGNLISGNAQDGIAIGQSVQLGVSAHDNLIQGNLIGTDPTGTLPLGNQGAGIRTSWDVNTTIGGTTPAARNIIAGNGSGVALGSSSVSTVQGNYLGTDITGTIGIGTSGNGISLGSCANTTVGGTTPAERNIIYGGVGIGGYSDSIGNIVQGNFVGTDVSGTITLGTPNIDGISITGGTNNTIGGTAAGAGNVVGGMASGIVLTSSADNVTNNLVQGNFIGTDLSGTLILSNRADGVVINDAAHLSLYSTGNTIGGTAAGAGNTIAFNDANGVRLNGGTDNAILGNIIFANANLGIDASNDGVTANDPDDTDTGPNQLQNTPVLSGAFTGSIRITGSLDSTPSTIFNVEFFANGTCDPSGYGEGETFLGSASVATDGNGDATFDITLPGNVPIGDFVTATATDPSGNTSEFSQCIQVVEGGIDVSIPDVQSSYATTIQIPVQVTDTSGKGIVAAEIFIAYDGDLITAFSAGLTGTLAENGWSIQTNIVQGNGTNIDSIKIAMATDNDVLVGAGTLVNLDFQVADIRIPSSTPLTLSHVLFNDGTPTNATTDGSLTIIGTTGTITSLPATIIPRETVTVTVVDIDLDTDGAPSTDNVVVTIVNTLNNDSFNLPLSEGAIAGTFSGTYDTEYGSTADGNLPIQATAGDAIVATYSDALDGAGAGPSNRTATTNVIGGADGTVEITLVSQPGDPLYIQVTDADLNTSTSSAQTASVTVKNTTTNDIFIVVLDEADDNDDVFFGSLPTTAGASTSTDLGTVEDDIVTVTYDDVVTLDGNQLDRTDDNDVIFPWGDADDNDVLQAFDAAKILLHVLLSVVIDEKASNVDDETITSGINPFDASLVLQKRVGLIATFPVQDPTSENHPQGTASPKLMPDQRTLSLVMGEGYLSLYADDRSKLLAGDLTLTGINGRVEIGAELADYLSASTTTNDGLRIVFAGAEAVIGPGELLRVYGVRPTTAALVRATFNNGEITGTASGLTSLATPNAFALHPNMPNPFNPETTIRFELPQTATIQLDVFDILGQKVRTLVAGSLQAGTHSAVWDGRNDAGAQVGNGVYLYRIETDGFTQMRRMLLLK